jgi:hypothetical protein
MVLGVVGGRGVASFKVSRAQGRLPDFLIAVFLPVAR